MFDAMQKQGRIWENEIAINTDSEEGTALLDEAGLQQGLPDDIAQLLLSLEVRQALKQLTAEQQQVIELLFCASRNRKKQPACWAAVYATSPSTGSKAG